VADFPDAWVGREMTIDVEAKAKERAVLAVMKSLNHREHRVLVEQRTFTASR
jgi:UV DNA damage endonuclease